MEMATTFVGIRIGTNYTTYAWNNGSLFDPAFVCGQWWNPSTGHMSVETPTIAVCNRRKKLKAFGFEAEKLVHEAKDENLLVFSEFIHQIFCNGPVPVRVTAENGVTIGSRDLMSKIISYLWNTISPNENTGRVCVLTIPTGVTEDAYTFLSNSAKKAGLNEVHIIPESASVFHYCRQYNRLYRSISGKDVDNFSKDKRSVVLDCEDDNISISILEAGKDDPIKILHHTFSNEHGLCRVQQDFKDMMIQIVGESVFDEFYWNHRSEYSEVVHDLRRKMAMNTKEEKPVNIQIPACLIAAFEKTTGKNLNEAMQKTKFASKISFFGSKCRIMPEIFQSLFTEAGSNMVQLVNQAMTNSGLSNIANIMLVGFFSKSAIFQDIIRKSFSTHHVIIPEDGNLVVVKGAAIFGQKPVIIDKIHEVTNRCAAQVAISSTDAPMIFPTNEVEHNTTESIQHHVKKKEDNPETTVSEEAVPMQRKSTKTCVLL